MKKILDKIIDFDEKNKNVLCIFFVFIIPVIIGIIGGIKGYASKVFLGGLFGFLHFGFLYFIGLFIVLAICYGIYQHREKIIMIMILSIISLFYYMAFKLAFK